MTDPAILELLRILQRDEPLTPDRAGVIACATVARELDS